MFLERPCTHEETDVSAGNNLLYDLVLRRSYVVGGIKNLFGCRDVIVSAGKEIGWTVDAV